MHVIDHSTLPRLHSAGLQRFAAARANLGFSPFELWVEVLEIDAATDILPLESARILLVLSGHGKLLTDTGSQRFHAPCSLVLPAGTEARISNIGAEPMRFVTGFTPPAIA